LAALLAFPWSAAAQDRYRNPIIFTRTEHDEKAGRVVAASRLWVMEEDGSGLRPVPHGDTQADHPSFYSDQRHILYAEHSGRQAAGDRASKLVKLDLYTGAREILKEVAGRCNLNHPALSLMGDLVSYQIDCRQPAEHAQWIGVGKDAYEIQTVAHNAVALPDGSIFMHQKDYATVGTDQFNPLRKVSIVRMFGHGAGARMLFLTDDRHLNRRPAVSADGNWFAWQTNAAGGKDEIFLARIDGSNPRNLTDAPGNDGHPWFSRDGKWIVFESDRTGTWEIWKVHIETRKAIQLTFGKKKYTSTRPRM
jgi:hypothetical protein